WEKGYDLDYDDSLVSYLAEKSYSPTYGARNLRRQIQKEVEDAIAAEIVDHLRGRLTALHVTAAEGKVTVQAE
ncbi:MAG: hypothetical protein LUC19_00125, partial [Oscillospiraceae bacterium]|nr:hypothetical protein [Oscillospiraceae bacterium]